MQYFISCNSPIKVNTIKGTTLVPCGHCSQCEQVKTKRMTFLCDSESQGCKYTEFLTLTYSDDFIPYIDTSYMADGITSYNYSGCTPLPIRFGNRTKKRYNPKTKEYMYIHDSSFDNVLTYKFGVNDCKYFKEYFFRRHLYMSRYPGRHFGKPYEDGNVCILWYEDLQRFKDRLYKWFRENYGEKMRSFAVGEYGTNSLRPHWHLLLFHNSDEFRRDMQVVTRLHGYTERNKRQCSNKILDAALWRYGDITSSVTDGKMGGYVSQYVNSSSDLPKVLEKYPQKTFKSIFLGEKRSYETISTLFKQRRFGELTTTRLLTAKGVEKDVSVPSSSYFRFGFRFSDVLSKTYQDTYALLSEANRFLEQSQINIYHEEELYRAMLDLLTGYPSSYRFQIISEYVRVVCHDRYKFTHSLNSLYQLFYAARKLYKVSNLLGVHPLTYCHIWDDFKAWLGYQNLVRQFEMLEQDSNYAYQYYSSINCDGTFDVRKMKQTSLYQKQQYDAAMFVDSNIKHKRVSDSYKFDNNNIIYEEK